MNITILFCSIILVADDPAQVQARVLYGTDAQIEQRADVELWISRAAATNGSLLVFSSLSALSLRSPRSRADG